jgi:hypothetical protein
MLRVIELHGTSLAEPLLVLMPAPRGIRDPGREKM